METKQKTLLSRVVNLLFPLFIPGHIGARLTLGCCLGLSIVGFMNFLFLAFINNTFGAQVSIEYGIFRTGIWIAANCYILYSISISRGLVRKVKVEKSTNAGESSAKVSVRRAA